MQTFLHIVFAQNNPTIEDLIFSFLYAHHPDIIAAIMCMVAVPVLRGGFEHQQAYLRIYGLEYETARDGNFLLRGIYAHKLCASLADWYPFEGYYDAHKKVGHLRRTL